METIYLVIRHAGDFDDYETTALKAFKKEGTAKRMCKLSNEEAQRILGEIKALEEVHKELFKDDLMTDEELDEYRKKAQDHWCQVTDILKSHKYDHHIDIYQAINYQYTPIKLY